MRTHLFDRFFPAVLLAVAFALVGCAHRGSGGGSSNAERAEMEAEIRAEQPGNYYIGRRYYKKDYKFWGYVRSPGQPWNTAKLVMLNENQKLAPDRELGKLGSDNNYEYILYGSFTGDTVYEPASNGFYPEFALRSYELRKENPVNIFRTPGATDPSRRIIAKPY